MNAEINKIIIETLLPFKPKQISVFGSYARGEMNDESDIDIMVDFPRGVTYFDIGGMYMDLIEKLGRDIDILTKGAVSPIYKPYIDTHLIEIYNVNKTR